MPNAETDEWLDAGIAAVKSGDKKAARQLLLKVIEVAERNEQAWLWLSVVAEGDNERRICLENVLAINPDNKIAQQGLANDRSVPVLDQAHLVLDRGLTHVTAGRQKSSFNDVWATEEDICAYCAALVHDEDQRCPICGRSLIAKEYRYAATANLHIYWVFLFTLAVIVMFQALYQFRIEQRMTTAIMHLALTGTLMVLVVGIYYRLLWAHLVSILVLILGVLLSGSNFLEGFDPGILASSKADPALLGLAASFIGRLGTTLKIVQAVIAGLSLLLAIFVVAPEFEQIKERSIARTTKGLHNAVDYHMEARRMMQAGKWAAAVLHWQRAAALDRTAVGYQRDLAKAYLRLGFIERGLNVLQSVRKLPMQDTSRSEIDKLLHWAQRQVVGEEK